MLQVRNSQQRSGVFATHCYLCQSYDGINHKKRTLCERTHGRVEFVRRLWLYLHQIDCCSESGVFAFTNKLSGARKRH
jgi:hypothetical protein